MVLKRFRSDDDVSSDDLSVVVEDILTKNEESVLLMKNIASAVKAAIGTIDVRILLMVVTHKGDLDEALKSAVTVNDAMTLIQLGADASSPAGAAAVIEAAKHERVDVIRALLQHGAEAGSEALLTAVTKRHLPSVTMLVDHDAPCDAHMAYVAASNGDVEILERILSRAPMHTRTTALYAAIKSDMIDVVEMLVSSQVVDITTDMLLGAPDDILEYLAERAEATPEMLLGLTLQGDARAVKMLLHASNFLTRDMFGPALNAAIVVGNAEILKLLLDEDTHVTIDMVVAATASNNDEIMKIVKEHAM